MVNFKNEKANKVGRGHRVTLRKIKTQKQPKIKLTDSEKQNERKKIIECMTFVRKLPYIRFYVKVKQEIMELRDVHFDEKRPHTLVYRDEQKGVYPVYKYVRELAGWKESAWKNHVYFSTKGKKPKYLIKFIDYFIEQWH